MCGWALRAVLGVLQNWGLDICLWASFPGCRHYQVSCKGQVLSVHRAGKLLKLHGPTYLQCIVRDSDGRRVHWLVHRAVVLAFIDNSGSFLECDHLDGQPNNNYLTNLRPANRA